MPRPSRFESEVRRRVVVALIMAALLCAATAVAVRLSRSIQTRHSPGLAAEEFDNFRYQRPGAWTPADSLKAYVFDEGGRTGRRLLVGRLATKTATDPDLVIPRAAELLDLAPPAKNAPVRRVRRGGLLILYYEVGQESPQGQTLLQQMALATVDGRRYLAMGLVGPLALRDPSAALLRRLVESIDDARYATVSWPVTIDGVEIDRVPGLRPLRRSDDVDDRVLFVPEELPRLMLLYGLPLDVSVPFDLLNARIAGASDEISAVPIEMAEALHPDRQHTPADRLLAAMKWRYWAATDVAPPAGVGRRYQMPHGVRVELRLNAAARLATYRALFGAILDDRVGVLVEVVSEHEASRDVTTAARLLTQAMRALATPSPTSTPAPDAAPPSPSSP